MQEENGVTIVNLADDIQYLEEVSLCLWQEWSSKGGAKPEDTLYRTRHSICKDRVPQMYIAKQNDEMVGFVSIWNNDLKARQDLSPWLATLFVKESYRGQGIGTLLQKKCIQVAKALGYERLYLITDLENYYEKSDWVLLDIAPSSPGHTTRIYVYTTT